MVTAEHPDGGRAAQGQTSGQLNLPNAGLEKGTLPLQDPQGHSPHGVDALRPYGEDSDPEKSNLGPATSEADDQRKFNLSRVFIKYRLLLHLFIWLIFTG